MHDEIHPVDRGDAPEAGPQVHRGQSRYVAGDVTADGAAARGTERTEALGAREGLACTMSSSGCLVLGHP
jgi:hypothetical protein